jgi:hypothetical protein
MMSDHHSEVGEKIEKQNKNALYCKNDILFFEQRTQYEMLIMMIAEIIMLTNTIMFEVVSVSFNFISSSWTKESRDKEYRRMRQDEMIRWSTKY